MVKGAYNSRRAPSESYTGRHLQQCFDCKTPRQKVLKRRPLADSESDLLGPSLTGYSLVVKRFVEDSRHQQPVDGILVIPQVVYRGWVSEAKTPED